MAGRRSREWWRRTVAAQVSSGLTVAEFSAREGLVEATFRWWARELRRSRAISAASGGFVEVVATPVAAPSSAGAVSHDDGLPESADFWVRVGSSVTVVFRSLPAPEYVARMAAAYEELRA